MRAGWAAGRSFLWWMVDGGCWTPGRRVPVCSGLRRGLASRLPSCRVVANRHPSPWLFGSGREVVVGVWGDWRKWGLMRAGGLSGFPGVG